MGSIIDIFRSAEDISNDIFRSAEDISNEIVARVEREVNESMAAIGESKNTRTMNNIYAGVMKRALIREIRCKASAIEMGQSYQMTQEVIDALITELKQYFDQGVLEGDLLELYLQHRPVEDDMPDNDITQIDTNEFQEESNKKLTKIEQLIKEGQCLLMALTQDNELLEEKLKKNEAQLQSHGVDPNIINPELFGTGPSKRKVEEAEIKDEPEKKKEKVEEKKSEPKKKEKATDSRRPYCPICLEDISIANPGVNIQCPGWPLHWNCNKCISDPNFDKYKCAECLLKLSKPIILTPLTMAAPTPAPVTERVVERIVYRDIPVPMPQQDRRVVNENSYRTNPRGQPNFADIVTGAQMALQGRNGYERTSQWIFR